MRVVITGASSGLGRTSALELSRRGARLVLAGRSAERHQPVIDRIREGGHEVAFVEFDLSSLSSVTEAAKTIRDGGPVSVLMNNAAVGAVRGSTDEGFELNFGVNYIGHFHLTSLLRDSLTDGRVVNLSSNAHFDAEGIPWDRLRGRTRSLTGFKEYAVSKLAIVLWSRELARRWPEVDVFCVHPGMVATPIWDRLPQPIRWLMRSRFKDVEEGVKTQVRCAVDPELVGQTGRYWVNERPGRISAAAADDELAGLLWNRTEVWLAELNVG